MSPNLFLFFRNLKCENVQILFNLKVTMPYHLNLHYFSLYHFREKQNLRIGGGIRVTHSSAASTGLDPFIIFHSNVGLFSSLLPTQIISIWKNSPG